MAAGYPLGAIAGGAAVGPVVGGLLFQTGFGLPLVAGIMACGSLFAALALPKRAVQG